MKTITIYQPYASLIFSKTPEGEYCKTFETRGYNTNVRGRVAIHAGLKNPYLCVDKSLSERLEEFWEIPDLRIFPRGMILGTVEIVDSVPVETIRDSLTDIERELGDYSDGRFAQMWTDYETQKTIYKAVLFLPSDEKEVKDATD